MSQPTDDPPPTSPDAPLERPPADGPPPDAAPPEALPEDTPPAVEEEPPAVVEEPPAVVEEPPAVAEPPVAEAEPEPAEPEAGPAEPEAGPEPAEPEPEAEPAEAAETPVRRGVRLGAFIAGGVVLGVLVVAAAGFAALRYFEEDAPEIGDCLADAAADLTVVDCEAGEAYWSVVGSDGNWRYDDFEAAQPGEVCAEHPTTQQALWITSDRAVGAESVGDVVCLAPVAGIPEEARNSD